MSLILNIDTSTETASICIARDGLPVAFDQNAELKDHASWIHVAIAGLFEANAIKMKDLDAIAVTDGPGSYTGLRVGMSAAKGLCYALRIPLITENTLKMMAYAAAEQIAEPREAYFCPLIDARRMEVFCAIYSRGLEEIMAPCAIVLDINSFSSILELNKIIFFGSGSDKWGKISTSNNAIFDKPAYHANYLSHLSYEKYISNKFTDVVYSQPAYLKDFHSNIKK